MYLREEMYSLGMVLEAIAMAAMSLYLLHHAASLENAWELLVALGTATTIHDQWYSAKEPLHLPGCMSIIGSWYSDDNLTMRDI